MTTNKKRPLDSTRGNGYGMMREMLFWCLNTKLIFVLEVY